MGELLFRVADGIVQGRDVTLVEAEQSADGVAVHRGTRDGGEAVGGAEQVDVLADYACIGKAHKQAFVGRQLEFVEVDDHHDRYRSVEYEFLAETARHSGEQLPVVAVGDLVERIVLEVVERDAVGAEYVKINLLRV